MIKRIIDIVMAVFLLTLCAPVMALVALVIRLVDGAPVLFRQRRVGRGGSEFVLYKFRSMRHSPEWDQNHLAIVQKHLFDIPARRQGQQAFQGSDRREARAKQVPEKHLTRIGRFLRRTNIDELPQLYNILRGDMSLVGPRPPIPYEIHLHTPAELQRLCVRPGLTGLWQVSGRHQLTYKEMIQLDLKYVRTRSLALDLKILLRTPRALFYSDDAR